MVALHFRGCVRAAQPGDCFCLAPFDAIVPYRIPPQPSQCNVPPPHLVLSNCLRPADRYAKLGKPDVQITNPSDKDVQLLQLQKLNELVSRVMSQPRRSSAKGTLTPRGTRPIALTAEEKAEVNELQALFGKSPPPPGSGGKQVDGLRELLEGLNLEEKLEQAQSWCGEQGIESVAELKEADMTGDLAGALHLKPAKKKLLLKRIADTA